MCEYNCTINLFVIVDFRLTYTLCYDIYRDLIWGLISRAVLVFDHFHELVKKI